MWGMLGLALEERPFWLQQQRRIQRGDPGQREPAKKGRQTGQRSPLPWRNGDAALSSETEWGRFWKHLGGKVNRFWLPRRLDT